MGVISFENAYHWLNKYDGSHLVESNEHLVRVLNQSLGDKKTTEAWHIINRLKTNSEHITDKVEVGEIYVECGKAAYKLGDYNVSAAYFEDAKLRYGWRTHHAAIVGWLLGYSYWGISGKKRDTFKVWGESIRKFEELHRRPGLARDRLSWYGDRVEEMKCTLLCYQDDDCVPDKSGTRIPASKSPKKGETPSKSPGRRGTLRLFQIIDSQPAEGEPPESVDRHHIDYIELDQMGILGSQHNIVSLFDENIIDVHSGGEYKLLKVAGTCMEQRGIEYGDYVLLRVDIDPVQNDIVAFKFTQSGHAKLELRVFNIDGNMVTLEAKSHDDCHTPINRTLQEFSILLKGVALAVFKPLI